MLHAAAEGGSKDMFEAVMAALHHAFGPEKVLARRVSCNNSLF